MSVCGTISLFICLANGYNDTNTDGFISCQKEINDIVVIVTVFAMLIWN